MHGFCPWRAGDFPAPVAGLHGRSPPPPQDPAEAAGGDEEGAAGLGNGGEGGEEEAVHERTTEDGDADGFVAVLGGVTGEVAGGVLGGHIGEDALQEGGAGVVRGVSQTGEGVGVVAQIGEVELVGMGLGLTDEGLGGEHGIEEGVVGAVIVVVAVLLKEAAGGAGEGVPGEIGIEDVLDDGDLLRQNVGSANVAIDALSHPGGGKGVDLSVGHGSVVQWDSTVIDAEPPVGLPTDDVLADGISAIGQPLHENAKGWCRGGDDDRGKSHRRCECQPKARREPGGSHGGVNVRAA